MQLAAPIAAAVFDETFQHPSGSSGADESRLTMHITTVMTRIQCMIVSLPNLGSHQSVIGSLLDAGYIHEPLGWT